MDIYNRNNFKCLRSILLEMIESLAEMTWKNPIFMLVFFGAIWFIPGILLRRIKQANYEKKKAEKQLERIKSLYPDK